MKTTRLIIIGLLGISSALITSCTSSGIFASANTTQVQLNKANYKIVATSVTGTATSKYILGLCYGFGIYNTAFGLIPLTKDRALYKLATLDLWTNFETKYGPVQGKRLALINVRYDTQALNLLVYASPTLTIVADVVEFTE